MKQSLPKTNDFKTLLLKASNYCVRREHCQHDVFQKLKEWGADSQTANQVIAELINLNFINEERFAKAFVNDKLKFRNWGPKKLEHALQAKRISEYSIQKALSTIQELDKTDIIQKLILKKRQTVQGKTHAIKEQKVIRYLLSKGYAYDDIKKLI